MAVVSSRWSMGSVLFLASWAVLMGPIQYAQHLLSGPRLPFTAAYFTSIGLTLFFAIKVSRPPSLSLSMRCRLPTVQLGCLGRGDVDAGPADHGLT